MVFYDEGDEKYMKKRIKCITAFILACVLCFGILGSNNTAEAASTKVFKTNVSESEATCNATDGSLPTSVTTVYGNSSYYFNFAVSEDIHVTKAVLYIKKVGASSFTKAKTITPSKSYIRYSSYKYTFANTAGTFKYYWVFTYYTTSSSKTYTKTTSTASLTVKKSTRSITTNYTGTSSGITSSSYYAKVIGTKTTGTTIKAGTTFYTYYKSGSTYKKSTNGTSYYVKVGSSYVYVAAAQCLGFAHYVQYLLYGGYDGTSNASTVYSGFTQIAKGKTTTSSNAKTYITQAGAGAHIRVYDKSAGCDHSLIVISVTSKGFYYVDANGTSGNNVVSVGYYSWSSFASKYTKIRFIRYYTG